MDESVAGQGTLNTFTVNPCDLLVSTFLQVKKKDESAAGEEEERTVSIIASLLNLCTKQVGGRLGFGCRGCDCAGPTWLLNQCTKQVGVGRGLRGLGAKLVAALCLS